MITAASISSWFSLSREEQTALNNAINGIDPLDGINMLAGKIEGTRKKRVAALLVNRCRLERHFQNHLSRGFKFMPGFEDYNKVRDRGVGLELATYECSFFKERNAWVAVIPSQQDLKIHEATKHLFMF